MRTMHNQPNDSRNSSADEKRSNEYESASLLKKVPSQGSELESRSPEKKPPSEVSFVYTVTESVCSGNQRSIQLLASSKSTTCPVSQMRLKDAAVQTDQSAPILLGRDCLETSSCSWTQQHMNQPAHPMDFPAVSGRGTNRPPLLPNVAVQAVSQVSRGRSTGAKRLRSPPREQVQIRAQLLQSEQNNELLPEAESNPGPTKAIPAFPGTKPRQAPRCRKRLGHDVSKFSLNPPASTA